MNYLTKVNQDEATATGGAAAAAFRIDRSEELGSVEESPLLRYAYITFVRLFDC